ncbi:glycosyltransferase family 2 protein [Acerihabitans sp. KWT182]|uniref:Glycosyltransferase family 2 protein n=1 Tax=Acerihabitans sp. KWT182 TaxID=3157919 RepID=A0AAU7Q6A3_9GAMM
MTKNSEKTTSVTWQVPDYVTQYWAGKTKNYCVVIPVINEGKRIENLLKKMLVNNIHTLADIIIVDGGSTDGSLSNKLIKDQKVSALLIKTGPGRLSAQLRCAYAFALQNKYKGIVTIDGNNKDDPAAIGNFIAALEQGIDFVQASRFISGGVSENIPLLRNLAIRLIHAPMLAFFSGFHWTDTTQGFRAYSSKMLSDNKISIFRNIFDGYELLAYLSYCAPKMGFRCLELPTSRRYPRGQVPTKIRSVSGNLAILVVLLKACLGKYNI